MTAETELKFIECLERLTLALQGIDKSLDELLAHKTAEKAARQNRHLTSLLSGDEE